MASSRIGFDLIQLLPGGFEVPAPVDDGESIGANTLVGINASGKAEQATEEAGYQMVLVATEELKGGEVAKHGLRTDCVIVLEGSGFTQADLGKIAYIVDHKTVSTTKAGTVGDRDAAGRIVEVISATRVRVHVA